MTIRGALQRGANNIRQLPYLRGVLSPLDTSVPWSELNWRNYDAPYQFLHAVRAVLLPDYAPFRGVPHLPYEVPRTEDVTEDEQIWYFLNGITTDQAVLRLNGRALAELFRRRIYLMHNPSDGFVLDLLESAFGRTMQLVSDLDNSVARLLEHALEKHRKVVLIAHSQGGIIASGAINNLTARLIGSRSQLLNKLEVYTFASAATGFNLPQGYAEHFYHTRDYVARIGVAANATNFSGRLFQYDASGHLFNAHYLANLVAGRFESLDNKPSRLLDYIHNREEIASAIRGTTTTEH